MKCPDCNSGKVSSNKNYFVTWVMNYFLKGFLLIIAAITDLFLRGLGFNVNFSKKTEKKKKILRAKLSHKCADCGSKW